MRYEVRGPLRDVIACHCSQCRKTSGHFVAASQASSADIVLIESSTLKWYRSSPEAQRGFCTQCGGNLFWRPDGCDPPVTSIMAGTLDAPTGLKTIKHIFAARIIRLHEIVQP